MLTQTSIHYSFEQETNTQDDEDEDEITETQEQNKVWRFEIVDSISQARSLALSQEKIKF